MNTPTELPMEISAEEVQRLLAETESCLLVDCRETVEHEIGAIQGALLLPMNETPARLEELRSTKQRVIVYCHHGMRSLHVVRYLRQNGIDQSQSMAGGIDRWSCTVDPEIPRY